MTSGPWLVAAVSSVPALAAAHMLHLAALPKSTVGVTQQDQGQEGSDSDESDTQDSPSDECLATVPKGRSKARKPSLEVIRDAALNLDATGQRVTASALAKVFGVSERTGARYLSALTA
ncbi:hypothetical protein [Streptomyces chartreusis]|uniref:hypothetical protein n=1 Tax=Streptomyces chartreusis TaxID=1969 RepID=UPI00368C2F26